MEPEPAPDHAVLHALFVAVDGGARAAIAPVAQRCGHGLHDISTDAAGTVEFWSSATVTIRPRVVVVGTSDSPRGRRVEGEARRAAHRAGVPVVAIEDFPGNYDDLEGGEATALIVESRAASELCRLKLGARAPLIEIVAPARYDSYRARLDALRRHTAQQRARDASASPMVLWAGQPETDDCLRTLAALLPVLKRRGVEVAFKAHPRDPGHAAGVYKAAFEAAGVRYRDVTASSVDEALSLAPRLAVTQFSSVAIEAGFYGIPGLWILLPDAGGARLQEKKGYAVPPLALAGGALAISHAADLEAAFDRILNDETARVNLMRCFDDYFTVRECTASALLKAVTAFERSK